MKIHAIETGRVMVKQGQLHGRGGDRSRVWRTMLGREWTPWLPIHCWAIEHPEGVILVDTGETARALGPGHAPRWNPYFKLAVRFDVTAEREVGPQLRRAGIEPADVRWVVLTHMHGDHVGGLSHFPRAEIVAARAEVEFASGFQGKLRGYLPHTLPAWFAPRLVELDAGPRGAFSASLPLTDARDVWLVATPGHTPHHISVTVEDGERCVMLAGDMSYTQQAMVDQVIDGVTADGATARDSLRRTLEHVQTQPTVYLPSHDPEGAARLQARTVVPV